MKEKLDNFIELVKSSNGLTIEIKNSINSIMNCTITIIPNKFEDKQIVIGLFNNLIEFVSVIQSYQKNEFFKHKYNFFYEQILEKFNQINNFE